MSKRIEKLILKNFKGATCPVIIEFDSSKPTVMLFGENGTGKSTIIDAIDFVCNKSFGSLEERSTPKRNDHYIASLGQKPNQVEVTLEFGGDSWTGRIGVGNKPDSSGPSEPPAARILRRSQILKVVNGQPKERFEALKSFISVPNCEKSEQALREAWKDKKREYDDSTRAVNDAHESLEKLWNLEGSPGENYLIWARGKVAINETNLRVEVKALESLLDQVSSCKSYLESSKQSEQNYHKAQEELQKAEQAFEKAQAEEEAATESLIKILEDTQVYLGEKPDVEVCPVCERGDIIAKDLQERIQQRLEAMSELRKLKAAVDKGRTENQRQQTIHKKGLSDFVTETRKLALMLKESDNADIAALDIKWKDFSKLFVEGADIGDEAFTEAYDLLNQMKGFESSFKEKHENKDKTLHQLTAITGHLDTIKEKTANAQKLEQLTQYLEELLKAVEDERKSYVEEVLADIASLVEDIYTRVHPNEGIGSIRWYLREIKGTGSLEFEGRFQNKTVPPQAYFSESHLDTLGVCVFLALAKYYSGDNTIIVLDDVITSVDQTHMERFMQVLHDEAAYFNQLIITTHYRPWRDRYRYGAAPAGNIQLIELMHWSMPRGIRHTKTKLNIEELREYLDEDSFDRQIVASKSGILLESLLDHIALRYGCPLPRRPEPRYTLGDYLLAISGKLKKVLKIEKQDRDGNQREILLVGLLNSLSELMWIRDQVGCHFSIAGMDLSDSDVKAMGEKTLTLAEALVCNECGELSIRKKSGSYWECRCGLNKMHPLAIPN
jgi:recombinational DNA repair ATPase RecF